ncbi:hypothetical protein ACP70R_027082 [Stipagrostis hirtigluma subsp. patula]
MSLGRYPPGRGRGRGGGGGAGARRAEAPVPAIVSSPARDGERPAPRRPQAPGSPTTTSSSNAVMEGLLEAVGREIQQNARARAPPASSAPSSPSRCCPSSPSSLARCPARRVLAVARSSSAASSSTQSPPAETNIPREEQASSGVAGTSSSAPAELARTGSEQEARRKQHQAAQTRSAYGAVMRSALAKIQEGGARVEEQGALKGLTELTYRKLEPPNVPELPHELPTKWPRDDADPLQNGVMDDPVILASGHAPNQSTNCEALSIAIPPSNEQIQDMIRRLSGNPLMQEVALHEIQLLSKISKGMHPCLNKWPGLISVLINMQIRWKSTWTRSLKEELLTIILNLSVHRPNRVVLGAQKKLADALMQILKEDGRLGNSASSLAKAASVIGILSEFQVFRKSLLDIGGMEMLRNLLKIEDVIVKKEAVTAIRVLCTDDQGNSAALTCNVLDALLECLMFTDEVLLLLDYLPKGPSAVDKICGHATELVNVITAENADRSVTLQGLYAAISLVHTIVQRDTSKVLSLNNLVDFKGRLRELSCRGMRPEKQSMVETIVSVLERSPPPVADLEIFNWMCVPVHTRTPSWVRPCPPPKRSFWDCEKLRKLRPLRAQEQAFACFFFKDHFQSQSKGNGILKPPYTTAFDELQIAPTVKEDHSGCDCSGVMPPPFLRCPLSGEIMVDPVAISSGKTFDRSSVERWFQKHGLICPVTGDIVSSDIYPNKRVMCYLMEWNDAMRDAKAKDTRKGSQR